ncbi:MAG TPA: EamA family transporter, partial [Thermoplasmata archaeon]|nr:EamA family transporter [Thermoplasmata archaeon]
RPRGEGPWGETFQFVGGGAVSLAVLATVAPKATIAWTAPVVASVVYVGVLSMAVGYALFFDLIRRDGAVAANQVTFLNPVVALVLGVIAFSEPFAVVEVGGLALILLALALLHLPGRRARPVGEVPGPAAGGDR